MLAVVEPHRARVAPWSSPGRDPHAGLVRSQGGCTGGATCCFDICLRGALADPTNDGFGDRRARVRTGAFHGRDCEVGAQAWVSITHKRKDAPLAPNVSRVDDRWEVELSDDGA